MMSRCRHAARLPHHLARVVAFAATLLSTAAAMAYFTSPGTGSAQATVAAMAAPGSPAAQQSGANVSVTWGAASLSTGAAVDGYRVTRSDGASVCGTPTLTQSLSCTDTGVTAGTYTYTVTAVYRSWVAATTTGSVMVIGAPTVTSTPSDPSVAATPSFTFSGGGGSSYQCQLDGGTFSACSSPKTYSSLADGQHTFKVHATSGSTNGPDAAYTWTIDSGAPQITAKPASPSTGGSTSFSFSHTEGTYTFKCQLDGTGFSTCSSPKTYSSLADGSHTFQVQALSADGVATSAASATWVIDSTPPSGGGVSFTGGYLRATSVSVSFTSGTDSGTGVNASAATFTRASATLSGGNCGTFSSYSQIGPTAPTSPYVDTTVSTGNCYRYQYVVPDNAGNRATYTTPNIAEIDTQSPAHALSLSASSGAFLSAGEVYYKGNTAGSFQLSDTLSDNASGPASVMFPTTGWAHGAETITTPAGGPYASSTFSWSAGAGTPTSYTVTGADAAGNTTTSLLTFASDTAAPSGGAVTVNGQAATTGGATSSATSTNFTINSRTDYTEPQSTTSSGLQSSTLTVQSETLTGNACGTAGSGGPFTTPAQITGTTQPSGIQGGYCYLYTLAGTDHVGNAASVKVTVKVPIGIASMALANGGSTAGKPEQNDTISIQLNGPLSVSSVCTAWSNNNANQSLTNATVTFTNGGASKDSVSFSSPSCTLHLGTIDLGSTSYVASGSVTFGATGTGSTIAYSASTDTITVTLGTQQASTTLGTVASSVATFTPSSSLVGVDNNKPAAFATTSTKQF
jgi:hypothetical protein